MNWGRLAFATGVGAVGLGLVVLVAPDAIDVDVGQATVTLVGVVALVLTLWVVRSRTKTPRRQASTPEPERAWTATPPGSELQDATRQFWKKPHAFYRLSSREGIRAAAIAVLTRYENCSPDEARDRLERGDWTDDREAARFAREGDEPLGQFGGLRSWLGRESPYDRGLRRSIESIAAIADVQRDGPGRWRDDTGRDELVNATPTEPGMLDRRRTGHWRGISAVVLASVGLAVVLERPALLLAGAVGIWYVAYAHTHDLSPQLSVERRVVDDQPDSGDAVEVTVRLTNDGTEWLPDVRVLDGVPEGLSVVDGSARLGTALRSGETVEWTYAVEARRGVHEFEPALALVRNAPGSVEFEFGLAPETETALSCTPGLRDLPIPVPLRPANTRYTGVQPTTSGGDGTEFSATRRYQHGDDVSRIDWNRRAKTGELSTVLFREERMAAVMLLVDTSTSAYAAPEPESEHAVDRSVAAAGQSFVRIAADGHSVGVASLTDPDCWLEPGNGATHRAKARDLLATHPALQSVPSDTPDNPIKARQILQRRLPPNTQLVVFSPLCNQSVVRLIRRLDAAGHPVTVVSPDATADGTPSQQLARVGRRVHLTDLRRDGIPVLDWAWNEPLAAALARFAAQEGSP